MAGTLKVLVLDPAAGNHRTIGDYSAWVLLEADTHAMFYVDDELAREPVEKCLSLGVRLALQHHPPLNGHRGDRPPSGPCRRVAPPAAIGQLPSQTR
ncbi:MAG: hypothetical protein H0T51_13140 [Pirellulales bacterium]|nr:hypothetical protein [Pirellulales bacterium]